MKRAHRPVPIEVPPTDAPKDFKLTDSGVFEQGGIVFSKAGCVINKNTDQKSIQASSLADDACEQLRSPTADADATCKPSEAACAPPGATNAASSCSQKANSNSAAAADSSSSNAGKVAQSSQAGIALDDLEEVAVIGRGSSGVVKKVLHKPSGNVYVLKVINFDMGCEQVRRQVTTEVKAMDGARHPHIVAYHQSYFANGAMTILMELMDGGSLWDVLQKHKSIPEPYLPELARQVLLGLSYLHDTARICHRDIKPSNLLLSSTGQLKISDFGVSSQLSNSMSKCLSWVGTVTYMSPERIQGHSYGFNTDVWSLGLLLLECAVGRYPYPPEGETGLGQQQRLGFWELLEYIVVEPAPRLPAGQFSPELVDFVSQCLQKDAAKRPSASEMLNHPFVVNGSRANLSELLGQAPLKGRTKGARAAAGSSTVANSSSSRSRRSASAGGAAAATAPGSKFSTCGSQKSSSSSVIGLGRCSSMRGNAGSVYVGRSSSSGGGAAGAAVQQGSAVLGQLAPYTSTYQTQRPASSGAVVKACTPPKQQQSQQPVRQAQLRQQLHPDLQQHLLSRMQVAPQPQLQLQQRPVIQQQGCLINAQQQQQPPRQVLAQQQPSPSQRLGMHNVQQQKSQQQQQQHTPTRPTPQATLQHRGALPAPSQQQQQLLEKPCVHPSLQQQRTPTRPSQHLSQQQSQHRGATHAAVTPPQQRSSPQPAAVSSGPLTAQKPTPRKAPVAAPQRTVVASGSTA